MRIIHLTDSFAPQIGGIERQVQSLASHQRAAGHDVTVVTAVPGPGVDGLHVVRPAVPRWWVTLSPRQLRRLTVQALGDEPADAIVHAHLSVASPLAVRVAQSATRRRFPIAITVHSMWPSPAVARAANLPYWSTQIRGEWSAVSTVAAKQVARMLPRDRVLVVPNLVDTDWWRPRRGSAPAALSGVVRIVTVGRLAGRKRIGPLLEILACVRRQVDARIGMDVTIVGDGPRRGELARRIEQYGMADWVHLAGQQPPEAIRSLLHRSDLFVAPAHRESFGIAALEARAAGVPVVGFQVSGLADFIVDGRDGVLVDSDDELASALTELVRRPSKLARLRACAVSDEPGVGATAAVRAVAELYERALTGVGPVRRPPRRAVNTRPLVGTGQGPG